jgi:hypothetical protein
LSVISSPNGVPMKKLLTFLLLFRVFTCLAQATIPGTYPQASQRILSLLDIDQLDFKQLQIMRNEIFARYGHQFKNAELKAHFESQSWYKGVAPDVTASLTELEKKNVTLIKKQEDRVLATNTFEKFFAILSNAIEKNQMEKIVGLAHMRYMSDEDVRGSFREHWTKIKNSLQDVSMPAPDELYAYLNYETRMDGDQVDYIEFRKIGSCWYITGFNGAG